MKGRAILFGLWLPATTLVLWQLGVELRWIDPLFFPPPTAVLGAAGRMVSNGELLVHLGATLFRMGVGLLTGAVPGALFGIIMGTVAWIRRSTEPLVAALNSAPKLALLPMLMLFFGVGETARLTLVAVGCFLTMAIQSMDAVTSVNRGFVEMAVNYGADRTALWRKVYVPSALPQIFTGLRLALGRALVISISVELVSAQNGLGSLIWSAWQTFSIEKLYVGVGVSAGLGAVLHWGFKRLEVHFIPWHEQH
jgi:ABC-type nitrate/sulfonate/bicarbonate transport system permease component